MESQNNSLFRAPGDAHTGSNPPPRNPPPDLPFFLPVRPMGSPRTGTPTLSWPQINVRSLVKRSLNLTPITTYDLLLPRATDIPPERNAILRYALSQRRNTGRPCDEPARDRRAGPRPDHSPAQTCSATRRARSLTPRSVVTTPRVRRDRSMNPAFDVVSQRSSGLEASLNRQFRDNTQATGVSRCHSRCHTTTGIAAVVTATQR
jgi:hypothetical protein